MPPPPQKATIKQAKASYRQRGLPTISDSERRQLQRATKLEERAQRTREQERRRQEALRKRIEKEALQQQVEDRIRLGSQRRCDKFGFKSSQAHLGAFFGAGPKLLYRPPGNAKRPPDQPELRAAGKGSKHMAGKSHEAKPDTMNEDFDDDLDDQSLLEAGASCVVVLSPSVKALPPTITSANVTHQTPAQQLSSKRDDSGVVLENLDWLDLELDSSTQIARELGSTPKTVSGNVIGVVTNYSPFSSGGFDLSMEDIEALDPQLKIVDEVARDRAAMPPPLIPKQLTKHAQRPCARPQQGSALPTSHENPILTRTIPPVASGTGFSASQLERFIDDDIQLTQAPTG